MPRCCLSPYRLPTAPLLLPHCLSTASLLPPHSLPTAPLLAHTTPHRPSLPPSGPEREHRVRADFLDVSEPNIHPVWETTVLLWISKL